MRKTTCIRVVLAIVFACGVAVPHASATSFSPLYVFGDSLSDSGNVAILTGGALPPSPPYFPGRFSNGPTYADHLGALLGTTLLPSLAGGANFAYGGAWGGTGGGVPNVLTQVNQFFGRFGTADPDALYVVWGGANDVLNSFLLDPAIADMRIAAAVAGIEAALNTLVLGGATQFLISNLPNIGLTPDAIFRGGSEAATRLSNNFNAGLEEVLMRLSLLPGVQIRLLDTYSLVNAIFLDAAGGGTRFGMTNVTTPCLTMIGVCQNPDTYLFWDTVHPTARGHEILAEAAAVPEPATATAVGLGLIAVRAVMGSRRRRSGDR